MTVAMARSLLAGVALVVAGCGLAGGEQPGSPRPARVLDPAASSAAGGVSCRATTADATKLLPRSFRPVAVVRCYPKARGINGRGLWAFEVKQRADHGLGAFTAALRRPSIPTPPGVACLTIRYPDPSFVLIDSHGRVLRPALPVAECGQPFPAAISRLRQLPWVTVAVRRTRQLATRAELVSGCAPQYRDEIPLAGQGGPRYLQPSAGAPVFSPRPPRIRICIYRARSRTFVRGGFIGQAAESTLLAGIQGGLMSVRCPVPHASYAVLMAVSPTSAGGQIAEAELGGCSRIIRPDNRIGTITRAAMTTIRHAADRPFSR